MSDIERLTPTDQHPLQICRTGFQDGVKRDVSTIYELFTDAQGYMTYAEPVYQWRCAPVPASAAPLALNA